VLPAIFAIVLGNSTAQSPSIHPDDPASAQFSPRSSSPLQGLTDDDDAQAIHEAKGETHEG
jgi:hypothetical protein